MRRALRRAAWFLWIMPLLAALSERADGVNHRVGGIIGVVGGYPDLRGGT